MSLDTTSTERRSNHELRQRFVVIFEVLKPYFDSETQWAGHAHEHLAYRTIKEHFPELSAQDCFIAVITARRMFTSGSSPV